MNTVNSETDSSTQDMSLFEYFRSYYTVLLIAGIGGILPTISRIGASLASNPEQPLPGLGLVLSMVCFFLLGAFLCIGLQEKRVRDAFILGIAAPAIISNIVSGIQDGNAPSVDSDPTKSSIGSLELPKFNFSLIGLAHADESRDLSIQSSFTEDFLWGLGFQRNTRAIHTEVTRLQERRQQLVEKEKAISEVERENADLKAKLTKTQVHLAELTKYNQGDRELENRLREQSERNHQLQEKVDELNSKLKNLINRCNETSSYPRSSVRSTCQPDFFRLIVMHMIGKGLLRMSHGEDHNLISNGVENINEQLWRELKSVGVSSDEISIIHEKIKRFERFWGHCLRGMQISRFGTLGGFGEYCRPLVYNEFMEGLSENEYTFYLLMANFSLILGSGSHYSLVSDELWYKYMSEFSE